METEIIDKIWEKYDKDRSGKLSKDEAAKFLGVTLKEINGEPANQEEIERHFDLMDDNSSGDIDKEECIRFLKGIQMANKLKLLMDASSDSESEN